jgi:hypothetical protein
MEILKHILSRQPIMPIADFMRAVRLAIKVQEQMNEAS